MSHRPLITALLFQGGLIIAALVLAVPFGLTPWREIHFSTPAVALGAAATVPLLAGLLLLPRGRWQWADHLVEVVEGLLRSLFTGALPGAVLLVSLLAGVGEELLFRGVLQDGLMQLSPTWLAVAMASLLFGLAHAVSLAYFLIATLIGLYLGLLYLHADNLLAPMLTHALYDWLAIHYYLKRR